jgi:hypothetical protein
MLEVAANPTHVEIIAWLLVALFGLIGATAWEVAGVTSKITRWWSPPPPARAYDRKKIEELRKAATDLRDVCWGMSSADARDRLKVFRAVADDFLREPELGVIISRIEDNASRSAVMAQMSPHEVDEAARVKAAHDGIVAINDLFALSDKWVLYEPQ